MHLTAGESSLKALFPAVKNPIRSDVCFYPLERESTHIGSKVLLNSHLNSYRGVIDGKADKAAALPKFSDTVTLSQPRGADYAHPLALLALKNYLITPL